MKLKLYVLTALSLASLALTATPASAWWLNRHCGCNRYSTVVVCRPYNAFTPVCSGSLVCDGCCPQLPGGACCSPMLGNPLLAMYNDPAGINAGMAQMPMMQMPMQQMPMQQMPMQQMPVQMQMPQQMPAQQAQMPMPMPMSYNYMVQPAGYQPMYYQMPMQMPMNPYQQAPAYWYGN